MNKDMVCEIESALEKNLILAGRGSAAFYRLGEVSGDGATPGRHLKEVRQQVVGVSGGRGAWATWKAVPLRQRKTYILPLSSSLPPLPQAPLKVWKCSLG